MARIALAIGAAVGGFLIAGPVGLHLGIGAVIAATSAAGTLGNSIGSALFHPRPRYNPVLQDLNVMSSAEGSPIPFGYGTARLAGQIIWGPPITPTNIHGSGGGGNSKGAITGYVYFASFAVAFGEGAATVSRLWADSKLIYLSPTASAANRQVGVYSTWDSITNYVTNDLVLALTNNQVYEAILPNVGIPPGGDPLSGLYWRQATEYPGWDSGTQYNFGNLVSYSTQIYAATSPNQGEAPPSHPNTWQPLGTYYGSPTFYPGDELQNPDPLIQAAEGTGAVSAHRGICYCVFDKFPLANFANRVPNIRGEVTYIKTTNKL